MRRLAFEVLAATALAACSAGPGQKAATAVPDVEPAPRGEPRQELVYVANGSGLYALDPASFEVAFTAGDAVASPDWSRLVRTRAGGDGTDLEVLDPATGEATWSHPVADGVAVRVVAPRGDLVALATPRPEQGQALTTIVVASLEGSPARSFVLDGNYEPEAFTVAGDRLFVVEYTPPIQPERYQVRQLDLTTGEIGDVTSPDDELQEPMEGTARTQMPAPDSSRLYTFYATDEVHAEEGEEPYAGFIHVLDLTEGWAFCIDLPMPFGVADEAAVGLAVSADGRRLYVADRTDGIFAEVDTDALEVVRTLDLPPDPYARTAAAAVASTERVFLAGDDEVVAIDLYSFTPLWDFPVDGPVNGLHSGGHGDLLYAALPGRLAVLDPTTGYELTSFAVSGVRDVGFVGRLTPGIEAFASAQCAC